MHAQLSDRSHLRIGRNALHQERARFQEWGAGRDLKWRTANAGGVRNDGYQRVIGIAEAYADDKGWTNFPGHPEIEELHLAPAWRHSRLAGNRSAASAISESSNGPESNGTARLRNSTVKIRFSSSGSASKSSRSRAVCPLMFLGYPFLRLSATLPARQGAHRNTRERW